MSIHASKIPPCASQRSVSPEPRVAAVGRLGRLRGSGEGRLFNNLCLLVSDMYSESDLSDAETEAEAEVRVPVRTVSKYSDILLRIYVTWYR